MIYRTPTVGEELRDALAQLDELRAALELQIGHPSPWLGTLRRLAQVTSAESSVSIEGYVVAPGAAAAIVGGGEVAEGADESTAAVACYARAMDHVGVMATDPSFEWSTRVILDLHFDVCSFQRDKSPGRWRTDPISVSGPGGTLVYTAPDGRDVASLMDQVVAWLRDGDRNAHVVVRAALAHLHTVSVHPFRDGNGRISRIVQSLVLAREGLLAPEFASIEEYLAAHTPEYYDILQRVQGGRYQPERDATEWVEFCLAAHIEQARRRLDQIAAAGARWTFLEQLVEGRGWPDRLVIALEQSLAGGTDRALYGREAEIATATASTDLRRLVDAGLIAQVGRGRGTRYGASGELRAQVASVTQRPL